MWTEYLDLLHNGAHIMFELTLELITGVLIYPVAKWVWGRWMIRHDAEHHSHEGTN